MTIHLILLVLACAAFVAAAVGVSAKVNLVAVGLALLVLSMLVR